MAAELLERQTTANGPMPDTTEIPLTFMSNVTFLLNDLLQI